MEVLTLFCRGRKFKSIKNFWRRTRKIITTFKEAVIALGIKNGPSKGDLIVTDKGVFVLEITSRLSPATSIWTPQCLGIDNLTETINWSIGNEVNVSNLIPDKNLGMAHRYFSHQPGKIKAIRSFDNMFDMRGVIDVKILNSFSVGDTLEKENYINRLFYIITKGRNRERAIINAKNALANVEIEIE